MEVRDLSQRRGARLSVPGSGVPLVMTGVETVHFIGIGGVGMSGMARLLVNLGYRVTGSDLCDSPTVERLRQLGIEVYVGHCHLHTDGADVVVVSSAIPEDNLELRTAQQNGKRVIHRSEMLAWLMNRQRGIAITGTHGKSTTTSMVATILERCEMDPTVVVGGELYDIGGNAKLGCGDYLVAEVDESDGSLLNLRPEVTIVTNIEPEHLDHYQTEENLVATFRKFLEQMPENGMAVLCKECHRVFSIGDGNGLACLTYGFGNQADLYATDLEFQERESAFNLWCHGDRVGRFRLKVPGAHNVLNALAALGVARHVGMEFDRAGEALSHFTGIERRFQKLGQRGSTLVFDDYAHHPTEVIATLHAAKQGYGRRIVAVFQPHRYTRTHLLGKHFGKAFSDADVVIVTDIYAAYERPIAGVSGETIVSAIRQEDPGKPVEYIEDKRQIPHRLEEIVGDGDLVVTLGAGDIRRVAEAFAASPEG